MPKRHTAGLLITCLSAALSAALSAVMAGPAGAADPPDSTAPSLSFSGSRIQVSGVAAGGRVALFGVAHEVDDYVPTFRRQDALLTDDDRDGLAVLDLERVVPGRSLWVAVDLASGRAAVATPPGYPLREIAAAETGVRWDTAAGTVEVERSWVEGLVVQPGVGAWRFTAGDGGLGDEDGKPDGTARVALDRAAAVDPALPATPQALRAGDLLFVIDPGEMALLRGRVPAEVAP